MRHSTRAPTKAERAHLAAVKALPCVACGQLWIGSVCGHTEVHHLLSGNKRRGHMFVLPLGRWHHQSVPLVGWTTASMNGIYGPSLAHGSKPFRALFGDDETLLARVNAMLAQRRAT